MLPGTMKFETTTTDTDTAISYSNVWIAYDQAGQPGQPMVALTDVSFEVKKGSFTSIIGPSGCGKTSLLRLCAGFQAPSSGTVLCNGNPVDGLNHEVGYITQQNNLYPWMTTRQNVEFALESRGVGKTERHRRADLYLSKMGLSDFADHYPHQLSGGMQKRASIAQTLIYEPLIILMDEPFAGLDSQTRMAVEADLLRLWTDLRPTIVFITHDLAEAIALSDEVVVISERPGRLKTVYEVPIARPRDVYQVQADPAFSEAYSQLWDDFRLDNAPAVAEAEDGARAEPGEPDYRPVISLPPELTQAPERHMLSRRARIRLAQLGLLVLILGLWELLSDTHVLDPLIFSHPVGVLQTLVHMLSGQPVEQKNIYPQIWTTFSELAVGFLIGSFLSIGAGIALARNRTIGRIIEPFILAWFGIPIIAIAPIFVLLLGIGFNSKVGTAVVATFFAVFFQTFAGVSSLKEEYFLLARLMGASRWEVIRKVLLPGSLPFIFIGLRMGIPVAMTGAVVGEFIASSQGLGAFILNASSSFDAAATFAALLLVVIIVTILSQAVRLAEKGVVRWNADSVVGRKQQ
jgi:NitT/TauT family transport system ATP-binding protein